MVLKRSPGLTLPLQQQRKRVCIWGEREGGGTLPSLRRYRWRCVSLGQLVRASRSHQNSQTNNLKPCSPQARLPQLFIFLYELICAVSATCAAGSSGRQGQKAKALCKHHHQLLSNATACRASSPQPHLPQLRPFTRWLARARHAACAGRAATSSRWCRRLAVQGQSLQEAQHPDGGARPGWPSRGVRSLKEAQRGLAHVMPAVNGATWQHSSLLLPQHRSQQPLQGVCCKWHLLTMAP